MLVVDLLHEFEFGVWKAVFSHLIRILWYLTLIHMLSWQCAIPTFEGLLPSPHNQIVMTLLYRLAEWHALAKLRMHTDNTLCLLDSITAILGRELRRFHQIVCSAYSTKDLPKENAARQRKKQRDQARATINTAHGKGY